MGAYPCAAHGRRLMESDEVELHAQVAKLLRVQDNKLEARGLGYAKLLMHKKTGKILFILRQEETAKIVCNFYVIPTVTVRGCGRPTTFLTELRDQRSWRKGMAVKFWEARWRRVLPARG